MKVFALTKIDSGKNVEPQVFVNKDSARRQLLKKYNELLDCAEEYLFSYDINYDETYAEVIYTDDTYAELRIYAVDLKEV